MINAFREMFSGSRLRSQLIRGGSGNLILRVTYVFLIFALSVLLARLMGASDYGVYSYVYAIIMVLIAPAQFGLPTLIVRETARSLEKKEWGWLRGVWQWGTNTAFILSAIIAGGTLLFLWFADERINMAYRQPLLWGMALLLLLSLSNLRAASLRGLNRVLLGQFPEQVLTPGLFIIFIALAAFHLTQPITPVLAMQMQVAAALCAFLFGAVLLLTAAPRQIRKVPPLVEGRAWFFSTLSLALISGMQMINKWASLVILGLFVPPAQVGIYRIAVQMAILADFGLQVVNPVIAPQIARLFALGDRDKLQRLATSSARITFLINALISLAFILLGRLFIQIFYGAEFLPAFAALLILLVGGVVNSLTGPVGFLLNMTGHENHTLKARLAATLVTVALTFLLAPLWGIVGAAAASSLAMIIWNVLLWFLVKKHLQIISLPFKS